MNAPDRRPPLRGSLLLPLLPALLAGCSPIPCEIETQGDVRVLREGELLRAWVTWDGKAIERARPLRNASVTWRSSIDGELDVGAELRTDRLSAGTHRLTARIHLGGEWASEYDGETTIEVLPAVGATTPPSPGAPATTAPGTTAPGTTAPGATAPGATPAPGGPGSTDPDDTPSDPPASTPPTNTPNGPPAGTPNGPPADTPGASNAGGNATNAASPGAGGSGGLVGGLNQP